MKKYAALIAVSALALFAMSCSDDSDDNSEESAETTETTAADTSASETTEAASDTPGCPSDGSDLLAGVPDVANATQTGQESIQEGGTHIEGTIDATPADAVADYQTALEANGWEVEGSGGDPSGEFGAGVQATCSDGRYLSLNAGGPGGGTTFGNLCVWPQKPSDTNCGNDDQDNQDDNQDNQNDNQDDGDLGGPPAGVEGFIPDEVQGFIP